MIREHVPYQTLPHLLFCDTVWLSCVLED